jgi:hypothetical protein
MNETKHIIYESLFIYNTSAIHQLHSIATYMSHWRRGSNPRPCQLLSHPRYEDLNWGIAKLRPQSCHPRTVSLVMLKHDTIDELMKPWFSHKNRRRSSYASRILISKTVMASWDNFRQNEARIFEIRQKLSEWEQKMALYLYFRADFNNSPTI